MPLWINIILLYVTEVVLAWILLYTGLFSLRVIFALLHLQSALSQLEFAHMQLC